MMCLQSTQQVMVKGSNDSTGANTNSEQNTMGKNIHLPNYLIYHIFQSISHTTSPKVSHIPHLPKYLTYHIFQSISHTTSSKVSHIPHLPKYLTYHIFESISHITSSKVSHISHLRKYLTYQIFQSISHTTSSKVSHIPHLPKYLTNTSSKVSHNITHMMEMCFKYLICFILGADMMCIFYRNYHLSFDIGWWCYVVYIVQVTSLMF